MPLSNNIKAVTFDCDGVLFDTQTANKAYYNRILTHFGYPEMSPQQFAFAQMHTVEEVLTYLFPDENQMEDVHAYRQQMSYAPFMALMQIEPNLTSLLKKLKPRYKTAVATNRTDSIRWVLDEFELADDFDFVVCASDVERPKPFPDLLIKVCGHFQLRPQVILYVGDSEVDQMAADAAGMLFAAYRNPILKADLHVSSLKQIEEILQV